MIEIAAYYQDTPIDILKCRIQHLEDCMMHNNNEILVTQERINTLSNENNNYSDMIDSLHIAISILTERSNNSKGEQDTK